MYFTFYIVQGRFLTVRRSERVGEWSNPWSFFSPKLTRRTSLRPTFFPRCRCPWGNTVFAFQTALSGIDPFPERAHAFSLQISHQPLPSECGFLDPEV